MTSDVTWTITQLVDWVNAIVAQSLGGEIWVEGEISNLQRASSGHVYFTLVESKSDGESTASGVGTTPSNTLSVTLFKWTKNAVNNHLRSAGGSVRMSDGVRVRVRGAVEVYGARSQFQLRMSGIDPLFTLGSMAAERTRILEMLQEAGLLDANKQREVPPVPTRLGVVTSIGSAAHADTIDELSRSLYGLEILVADARVQGTDSPGSICAAIDLLSAQKVDLILIVRGGGARTDLAAFDDEAVARAIATSTTPVWTGIGHEVDSTIADDVSNRAYKTPTACAQAVVEHVAASVDRIEELWEQTLDAASSHLDLANRALEHLGSRISRTATTRLETGDVRLREFTHRIRRGADAHLIEQTSQLDAHRRTLTSLVPRILSDHDRRLRNIETTVRANDPVLLMAKGWSITRTSDGSIARAEQLQQGDELTTTLAGATVRSAISTVISTEEG